MKKHILSIMTGFLLLRVVASPVESGLATAHPVDGTQLQVQDFQFLSVAPSSGIVKQPQLIPGAGGAIHLAYSAFTISPSGQRPAYYAYCPSNCLTDSSWSLVPVGDQLALGDYTRLAVDGNDHPRLMWSSTDSSALNSSYQYAECNVSCTNKANWSTPITLVQSNSTGDPHYYFALDHLGRPRFVYADRHTDHTGTYYVYCDSGCTSAGNWHEVKITNAETFMFSLVFTSTNLPRVAYKWDDRTNINLVYAECNSACDTSAGWTDRLLYLASQTTDLRLRLDSADQPRLAFYSGNIGIPDLNDLLYYGGCNFSCLNPSNWIMFSVGLAAHWGETFDMILDDQDIPHIALYVNADPFGLMHLVCSSNCDNSSITWTQGWIETSAQMNIRVPIPVASGCSISTWYPGMHPSLGLVGGAPVFAYDAEHLQAGICPAETDMYDTTFALRANGSPPPGNFRVYLPALRR